MKIETACIHEGYTPKQGEPRQLPVYQSTTFKYDTSDYMGKLFDLEAEGYFYTRLQNPTNDSVAAKICAASPNTSMRWTMPFTPNPGVIVSARSSIFIPLPFSQCKVTPFF